MVKAIRNIELALGSDIKEVSDSEKLNMLVARKSIIASKNIKKGEVFSEDNISIKRPGSGMSPMKWDEVIGQKASKDYEEDELI